MIPLKRDVNSITKRINYILNIAEGVQERAKRAEDFFFNEDWDEGNSTAFKIYDALNKMRWEINNNIILPWYVKYNQDKAYLQKEFITYQIPRLNRRENIDTLVDINHSLIPEILRDIDTVSVKLQQENPILSSEQKIKKNVLQYLTETKTLLCQTQEYLNTSILLAEELASYISPFCRKQLLRNLFNEITYNPTKTKFTFGTKGSWQ